MVEAAVQKESAVPANSAVQEESAVVQSANSDTSDAKLLCSNSLATAAN